MQRIAHGGGTGPARALAGALAAAARGWRVFPCRGIGPEPKAPVYGWPWAERNTAEPRLVRAWLAGRRAYGVACGPSRLVIIDLDTAGHHGGDGETAFAELCARAGVPWPDTFTIATPSGGVHLYFRADPRLRIGNSDKGRGLPPNINVRGIGGYVVGPGSVIPAGRYEVFNRHEAAPLPVWLAELLAPPPPRPARAPGRPVRHGGIAGLAVWLSGQSDGNRNNGLFWAACRAAEEGGDPWPLVPVAVEAGLEEGKARATVASAVRTAGRGSS